MLAGLIGLALMTGCASTPSDVALCDGTASAVRQHAADLVASDDIAVKRSGLALLDKIEAGCK